MTSACEHSINLKVHLQQFKFQLVSVTFGFYKSIQNFFSMYLQNCIIEWNCIKNELSKNGCSHYSKLFIICLREFQQF